MSDLELALSANNTAPNNSYIIKCFGNALLGKVEVLQGVDLKPNEEYIIVQNLHYDEHALPLTLTGTGIRKNIILLNCHFSNIKIKSIELHALILIDTIIYHSITAEEANIKQFDVKKSWTTTLNFRHGCFITKLHIYDICIIKDRIYSSKSNFVEFSYEGNQSSTEIILDESTFALVNCNGQLNAIRIESKCEITTLLLANEPENKRMNCHHVLFQKDSICNNIYINNFNCAYIVIQNKSTIGTTNIKNAYLGLLSIHGSISKQFTLSETTCSVSLEDATINSFKAIHCSIVSFNCERELTGRLYIDSSSIGELTFQQAVLTKDSIYSFSNSKISQIGFEQFTTAGQLQFKEINTECLRPRLTLGEHVFPPQPIVNFPDRLGIKSNPDWSLDKITNNDTFQIESGFEECRPQLRICRSSMGKTEFIGCDFSQYELYYQNSKLLEMFVAGTTLPKNDADIFTGKNFKELNTGSKAFEQKTSLYSQLKKIFDNQGNIIEGNYYHSWAMQYQQKQLVHQLKTSWRKRKGLTDILFDSFAFWLNRVSNNHGESWWRALRFTFLITLLTFIAATLSMKYHFSWDYFFTKKGWQFLADLQVITDNFYKLPGFFLPTHKLEFLSEGTGYSPTFGHYCWDIISRIFIGYGIYQFISAFRRHSRKGA